MTATSNMNSTLMATGSSSSVNPRYTVPCRNPAVTTGTTGYPINSQQKSLLGWSPNFTYAQCQPTSFRARKFRHENNITESLTIYSLFDPNVSKSYLPLLPFPPEHQNPELRWTICDNGDHHRIPPSPALENGPLHLKLWISHEYTVKANKRQGLSYIGTSLLCSIATTFNLQHVGNKFSSSHRKSSSVCMTPSPSFIPPFLHPSGAPDLSKSTTDAPDLRRVRSLWANPTTHSWKLKNVGKKAIFYQIFYQIISILGTYWTPNQIFPPKFLPTFVGKRKSKLHQPTWTQIAQWHDCQHPEIGEQLGWSPNSVAETLYRRGELPKPWPTVVFTCLQGGDVFGKEGWKLKNQENMSLFSMEIRIEWLSIFLDVCEGWWFWSRFMLGSTWLIWWCLASASGRGCWKSNGCDGKLILYGVLQVICAICYSLLKLAKLN